MLATLLAVSILAQGQGSTSVSQDGGLRIAQFRTDAGRVVVYLPDDVRPGDRISGTVVAEPSGTTDAERLRNGARLEGMVLKSPGEDTPIRRDRPSTISIPRVAEGDFQISLQGTSAQPIRIPLGNINSPEPHEFAPPRLVQVGKTIPISGPFDGDVLTTGVRVGNSPGAVLAESPRKSIVLNPIPNPGPSNIRVMEGDYDGDSKINVIDVKLRADRTQLRSGESTKVEAKITGLDRETKPFIVEIENKGSASTALEGGNKQQIKVEGPTADSEWSKSWNLKATNPGPIDLEIRFREVEATMPPGFKPAPDDPGLVIGDGTNLKEGDKPGPFKFFPDDKTQPLGKGLEGDWYKRGKPQKTSLTGVDFWWQMVHTRARKVGDKTYRGGEIFVHLKHTGTGCEGGHWVQIVQENVWVGDKDGNNVPAKLVDGRWVPAGDPNHRGDWQIDTNAAGKAAKDPAYPHQKDGEIIDSPQRGLENLKGYFTSDTPPRTQAYFVMKQVLFYSFFVGKDGEICKTVSWGFTVTWRIRPEDDPTDSKSMNKATVGGTEHAPKAVDPSSEEGKQAKADLDKAIAALKGLGNEGRLRE